MSTTPGGRADITPPARPWVIDPWATDRTEHIGAHGGGADDWCGLRHPLIKPATADSQRLVETRNLPICLVGCLGLVMDTFGYFNFRDWRNRGGVRKGKGVSHVHRPMDLPGGGGRAN